MKSERFDFGKNWKKYLNETLSSERTSFAKQSLQSDFFVDDFSDGRFVDIGCGSGLFSYCALKLGAEEVISFDYDPDSVEATYQLYEKAGKPDHWMIEQGDILNVNFIDELNDAKYVYAWGVLHHTGSLYEAIDNTLSLVAPEGVVYLAIYNKITERDLTNGQLTSKDWYRIKRLYYYSPWPVRLLLEQAYIQMWKLFTYKRGSSPEREEKNNKRERGMSINEDIRDWLGGLPYEYATVEEIVEYVEKNHPQFATGYTKENERTGNNHYRFRREN